MPPATPRDRVLLVGTTPDITTAHAMLAGESVECLPVADARQAVELVQRAPVDVVVVDVQAGEAAQVELVRVLRADPGLADVQLLVLAPRAVAVSGNALTAAADDVLPSPFEQHQIVARVRSGVRAARLAASEGRLRTLMKVVPGAVYRCGLDTEWTMELISDEIEAISGYAASDFVRNECRSFASIIHPDDRAGVEREVADATDEGRPFSLEYRVIRADGSLGWVLERGETHRGAGRAWLDGVIFDLSARKQVEEELRANRAHRAAAEERARIARELHDSVSQALFSMTLHAKAAQLSLERAGIGSEDPSSRNVARLHELTQGALAEMRALIFELRPAGLREEGLVAALAKQASALTARHGLPIEVRADSEGWVLAAAPEEELYRLVLEALHNIVKHAAATTATVTLGTGDDGTLVAEIRDDGSGFDPTATPDDHFGLVTMRERAARAGGQLDLRTSPGTGTSVRVTLPRQTG